MLGGFAYPEVTPEKAVAPSVPDVFPKASGPPPKQGTKGKMKVVLQSDIIEKLNARGILAYVGVVMLGGDASCAKLALALHVKEDVMADCLKEYQRVQNLDPKPQPKKRAKPASAFQLPAWVSAEAWNGYEEMRKRIGAPMTDLARELAVKKLASLEKEGSPHTVVLENSIMNGWRGLFHARVDVAPQSKPKLRETEFAR
jgi:hypothetical protein